MSRAQRILAALPATSTELAALEGISVRRINADLQRLKRIGLCCHTDNKVRPTTKHAGRWPALWIRRT